MTTKTAAPKKDVLHPKVVTEPIPDQTFPQNVAKEALQIATEEQPQIITEALSMLND